jgi:hypothetical protein
VNIVVWHVHGSWTTAFVQWPASAVEARPDDLADVDVVVLQRPEEFELAQRWLHRGPGRDVPAVYVEHGLERFLADWDTVLGAAAGDPSATRSPVDRTPGVAAMTGRR